MLTFLGWRELVVGFCGRGGGKKGGYLLLGEIEDKCKISVSLTLKKVPSRKEWMPLDKPTLGSFS